MVSKLYQRDPLAPGPSDLFYITRADGTSDGTASFLTVSPIFAGTFAAIFAPIVHTHVAADVTDFSTAADARVAAAVGVTVQAYDADLTALAALSGTNTIYYRSAANTWTAVTIGSNLTFSAGTLSASSGGVSDGDKGDITVSASGATWTIDAATVTEAKQVLADNTTNNVVSTKHGYAPKSPADATKFLNGAATPDYALVKDSDLSTSDVTTNNATTAKHGFLKKLSNAATDYMDGSGNWSVPAGSGGTATIVPPQGRLTLTSNTPVMTADATAQSSVYYAPYVGKYYPVYSGSTWSMLGFTQLTMALDTSNQLLNNVYDLFVYSASGTPTIGAGPAWTNTATITVTIATPAVVTWTNHGLAEGAPVVFTTSSALPTGITAGTTYYVSKTSLGASVFSISTSVANASAGTNVATTGSQSGTHTGTNGTSVRGTGAGTTELELKDGIWTNKNSITLKNGAGAGTAGIAANTATYVGSIFCTANGQTGVAMKPTPASGGTNNIVGVFNAYNRVPVQVLNRDNNASWSYNSTTARCLDNNVNNRVSWIDGLQQLQPKVLAQVSGANSLLWLGIGFDNSTTFDFMGQSGNSISATIVSINGVFAPTLGFHYVQALEATSGSVTLSGSRTSPTGNLEGLFVDLML